jgi:hypothetical protein
MGLVSLLRRAHGMLLRVTPPIPGAFDCALDQLQPGLVCRPAGRRRKREQLPHASVSNHGYDWLPAWPAGMSIWPRMLRVGGHQPLLDGKHEIVRGMQGCRRQRRIGAA